jgi:moderate conductance mechanosensitive channel
MIRLLPLLIGLTLWCTALAVPAHAQPSTATQAPAAAQPPAAVQPALTAAQAQAVIQVLNDPKQRAALAAALAAIAKVPTAEPAQPPAPANPASAPQPAKLAIPLAPNSLGAQVLLSVSQFLSHTSAQVVKGVQAARSLPQLWNWLVTVTTDPWARDFVLDAAWRLGVALVLAALLDYGLKRAVRRPVAVLESWAPAADETRGPETGETEETKKIEETEEPDAPAEPEARAEQPAAVQEEETRTEAELSSEPPRETSEARAEAGETEPPFPGRSPSASIMLRRLPLVLARLLLDLVPLVGFGLVGHLVAASEIGGSRSSRLILLAVIDAYVLCGAIMAIARMMVSPGESRLRLFHIPDVPASWLTRWIRRIAVVGVFGYAFVEVGSLLGLSDDARLALLKTISLVIHVFLAIMVLQKRRWIAGLIRGRRDAGGPMARLRLALATVWHWIALVLIMALWFVWAVEVPNGFARLLRFTFVTGALLISARLLMILLIGLIDRGLNVPLTRFPNLETRLHLYHPVINGLLRFGVYALMLLALLQFCGLNGLTWLTETDLGQRIASAFATIAVTFLLAVAVWEAANIGIDRHLEELAKEEQAVRSARLRTLLPLLRSALAITILVFAGLTVLSEIGINIGPLLAGAGIIGVAIGFGSQKLVQDLINGIFLLLENAMQVGDQVTVSGLSGAVEALSVRTIRLRAGDGSVHVIPFSSVTSVTNVNRGIGNASVSVVVDYTEDTDHVAAVLTEIVAGMRSEPAFAGKMLSDLQLWGVDKIDGAGATIVGQVVCTDSGRWSVQREINRRIKMRFEELGIRLFNPMRTIAMPTPAQASPPTEERPHERSRAAE